MSTVLPPKDRRWIVNAKLRVFTHPDDQGPSEWICDCTSPELAKLIVENHNRAIAERLLEDDQEPLPRAGAEST